MHSSCNFPSELREAAATERRFEELIDTLNELRSPRIGRRTERRLDLVETLVLAEELLGEAHALRERAMELLDLLRRRERLDRRVGERVDLVLDALREQILEVVGVEIVRPDAEEEAVEDRRERLVRRDLV